MTEGAGTMIVMAAGLLATGSADATAPRADLILTNARVYTVEPGQPWAQAVAIADRRILAVGTAADVMRRRGKATKVVDLGGRMLLPAFGDAHIHPVFGGLSFSRCSLHQGRTLEDYGRIIAQCIRKAPGDGVIYGVGWEDSLFPPSGIPRKEVLDRVSTDRPLIFMSLGGHSLWLNSRALSLAGVTRDTPDPANGKIDRDPATGEPVGGLQEGAMALADRLIPPATVAEMEDSIAYVARLCARLGITSWHDAGIEFTADGGSPVLDAYAAVRARGDLTSRVAIDLKWQNEHGLDQLPGLFAARAKARALGLTADSVKFYVDGVIPQKTAAMLAPYEQSGSEKGTSQIPQDVLDRAVAAIEAKGMQPHFHAIGDGAVRDALDAIAYAEAHGGSRDARAMISHLNVVDPADQPRFGKLGAIAVFQPTWGSEYPYMRLTAQAIGEARMRYIYPAGSILRDGGMLAYGSDWPVGTANPLEGIEVAMTRRTAGDAAAPPLSAGEGVTLPEAIAAYTINVAFANRLDTEIGSIRPGKRADLIVLDRDLFKVPVQDISRAHVLLTLFDGRPVFGDLDRLGGDGQQRHHGPHGGEHAAAGPDRRGEDSDRH